MITIAVHNQFKLAKCLCVYSWFCLPAIVWAAEEQAQGSLNIFLAPIAIVVLILLLLTISSLQRSRLKHKIAERKLKKIRRDLEQRVIERTEKLAAMNTQLHDEIAQHKATEELLRRTEDHLHSIVNAMPSVIIGVTPQSQITHWNISAERATQVTAASALGRDLNEVYPDHMVPLSTIEQAVKNGVIQTCKNVQHGEGSHAQYSDITVYPLQSGDRKIGAVIRIDDVTQRVQLENMMVQNEKMMSLGELAAGMAHEINNPLSAIVQGVQNIQRRLSHELEKNQQVASELNISIEHINQYIEQREILRFLDSIREAGERAADIVKHMLEFSRYNNRSHSPTDLTVLLDHCLDLASSFFQQGLAAGDNPVQIGKHYPSITLPLVNCSSVEIQQVILNILRNAAHALLDNVQHHNKKSPSLEVFLRAETNHAVIEIVDNGIGMPEQISRHIFEPFFTTKEVGKGTGLGLSVSYFIITKHHQGEIDVVSSPEQGTRFIIKLPLHAQ